MAGFSTFAAVAEAQRSGGKNQRIAFRKLPSAACVARWPQSCWAGGGIPAAGGFGTEGKANGRVVTSATPGALPFVNPAGGETAHASRLVLRMISELGIFPVGTALLVDRIADCRLASSEPSGAITGLDATSRLAAGEGAMIFTEVIVNDLANANVINFGYTNQDGVAGRTTANITADGFSLPVGGTLNGRLWASLQAGDTGARSIDSITLVSGSATGSFAVSLMRPICAIPVPEWDVAFERDYILQMPSLSLIRPDSCLQWLIISSVTGLSVSMAGELTIVSG